MSDTDLCDRLRANVAGIRDTIANACRRVGRNPDDVRIVAVTKYAPMHAVRALLDIGVTELGENRVQQLARRAEELGADNLDLETPPAPDRHVPRWHMIGHLQRNKVRTTLRHTRILHSLDSVRLADEIERNAARQGVIVDAFLELNVAGESSKSGAPLAQANSLAAEISRRPHVRLCGLMTMAPFMPNPEDVRPCFARLRELRDELREAGVAGRDCVHLSMGMSNDYAIAVEEGATFVRIGSALFAGVNNEAPRSS